MGRSKPTSRHPGTGALGLLALGLALHCGTAASADAPGFDAAGNGARPPVTARTPPPARPLDTALAAVENGELERALEELEEAVAAAPDNLRLGSEYRQAAIRAGAYDRALAFFEKLVAKHPGSANLALNYGYAHVDKVPAAGSVTQVILANRALTQFSRALELEESWLARYTRGNGYLFWPRIFRRTALGIADLERALELAAGMERRSYHAAAWAALGDGHWRLGDAARAGRVWEEAIGLFPGDERLLARLSRTGEELDAFLEGELSPATRVATDLRELWEEGWQGACDCDPGAVP